MNRSPRPPSDPLDVRGLEQARQALDDQAEALSPREQARLRMIRQAALAEAGRERGLRPTGRTAAVLAALAAVVVAVIVLRGGEEHLPGSRPGPGLEQVAHNDALPGGHGLPLELLAGEQDPALYEDLDFAAWLAEQDHAG